MVLPYLTKNKIREVEKVIVELLKGNGIKMSNDSIERVNSINAVINHAMSKVLTEYRPPEEEELIGTLKERLVSNKALGHDEVSSTIDTVRELGITIPSFLIKNRELKLPLMEESDIGSTRELLEYLNFKIFKKTILVKSDNTIRDFRLTDPTPYIDIKRLSINKLALDALRYKKPFIALFKHTSNKELSRFCNKVMRRSKKKFIPIETPKYKLLTSEEMRVLPFRTVLSKLTNEDLVKVHNAFAVRLMAEVGDPIEVSIRGRRKTTYPFKRLANREKFKYILSELKKRDFETWTTKKRAPHARY
jgi:hypothetical protein